MNLAIHIMTVSSVDETLSRSPLWLRYALSFLAMQAFPVIQFRRLMTICGVAASKLNISLFRIMYLSGAPLDVIKRSSS
jgi:hypothetical protein